MLLRAGRQRDCWDPFSPRAGHQRAYQRTAAGKRAERRRHQPVRRREAEILAVRPGIPEAGCGYKAEGYRELDHKVGIRSSLPKTRPILIVFGLFSKSMLEALSFWIIFQTQTKT